MELKEWLKDNEVQIYRAIGLNHTKFIKDEYCIKLSESDDKAELFVTFYKDDKELYKTSQEIGELEYQIKDFIYMDIIEELIDNNSHT